MKLYEPEFIRLYPLLLFLNLFNMAFHVRLTHMKDIKEFLVNTQITVKRMI